MPESLRKFLMLQPKWIPLSLYFPLSGNRSPFTQISFYLGTGGCLPPVLRSKPIFLYSILPGWGWDSAKVSHRLPLQLLPVKFQQMGHPSGLERGKQKLLPVSRQQELSCCLQFQGLGCVGIYFVLLLSSKIFMSNSQY